MSPNVNLCLSKIPGVYIAKPSRIFLYFISIRICNYIMQNRAVDSYYIKCLFEIIFSNKNYCILSHPECCETNGIVKIYIVTILFMIQSHLCLKTCPCNVVHVQLYCCVWLFKSIFSDFQCIYTYPSIHVT